ncbi:integrase, catalytic region, zinc finger, CCHC-type containing protein [Tanacetum coccineum]
MFDKIGVAINGLRTRIDKTLLEDRQRRWMYDSQNSLREFYKTDVILKSASLSKNLKEVKEELIEEVHKMLNIFESMEQKVNRKSSKENILQNEIDRLLENQDLLITISELKNKLQTVDKGKTVITKFDKSETSGTLLCVTPLPKSIEVKAKKVSTTKVNTDMSKTVTSHLTPKNEQSQKHNENVLARGMYRITKTETQTPDSKTNSNVCNSTGVESSNSVRRQKSKATKSKDRVLKNKTDKRPSAHVWKMSSSVSIDSNKCEIMNSNVCQSNTSVLSTKTVNAVNDGSNIVCVSCGKDVFLLSHEKCVARHALSRNSSVKRALFTTPIAAKSKNLGATFVVAKSRFSVAKTTTATNKVSNVLPLSSDSSQSMTLSNYMKNKIATSRKWQKWFKNKKCFNWTPKRKIAQSLSSETKSRIRVHSTSNTPITTQKWVAKLSTLSSAFVSCDAEFMGTVRFRNDHFAAITGYVDYVLACEQRKSKKASFPSKLVPSTESKLELLHMDLCGPMRVACINGKKYILVIVDDYSRYTWIHRKIHNQCLQKADLDNLFGPLYEEYYATSSPEVSDNSATNTLDNENVSSSSSIVVEEDEAPQIVLSSAEQVTTEPTIQS